MWDFPFEHLNIWTNLRMLTLGHSFIPYFAPVGRASLLHSFFEVRLFRQQHFFLQCIFVLATKQHVNWGKPERAPHRRVERDPCLYVCMHMSYHEFTLLQITDPEFVKDCMCHVNHNVFVQWTWRDLCFQSTSQMKSTEVQTSPMLASGAKLLPCGVYAC